MGGRTVTTPYAYCELCGKALAEPEAHTCDAFGMVADYCEAHCPRCWFIDQTGRLPESESE